jgi:hypothetical protein
MARLVARIGNSEWWRSFFEIIECALTNTDDGKSEKISEFGCLKILWIVVVNTFSVTPFPRMRTLMNFFRRIYISRLKSIFGSKHHLNNNRVLEVNLLFSRWIQNRVFRKSIPLDNRSRALTPLGRFRLKLVLRRSENRSAVIGNNSPIRIRESLSKTCPDTGFQGLIVPCCVIEGGLTFSGLLMM